MAIFNSYVKLSEGRHIHLIPFVCFCRLTSCETTGSAMKTTGKGEHRCGKPMGWLGGNEIDYTIIYYFDIVILGELMSLGWLYGIYIYMILWYTTWLYTNMYSHIIKSHTIPATWLLSLHNPPAWASPETSTAGGPEVACFSDAKVKWPSTSNLRDMWVIFLLNWYRSPAISHNSTVFK